MINKVPEEPYRMFTSSAEYRLILRQDNADLRLMEKGYSLGLVEKRYMDITKQKRELIADTVKLFKTNTLSPNAVNNLLESKSSTPLSQNEFISNILKRNEVNIHELVSLFSSCAALKNNELILRIADNEEVLRQVEIDIKYDGYIKRQNDQIDHFNKNEGLRIPPEFKYERIKSLSTEALDKLKKIRPASIGQASRIAGVNPSDVSAILIYMRG
ncbi:MAG: hypothetical protein NTV87_03705 [Ignavibacteriae bacterium]|nr:hypothetical protein [Ignavibacteriota bacterium]